VKYHKEGQSEQLLTKVLTQHGTLAACHHRGSKTPVHVFSALSSDFSPAGGSIVYPIEALCKREWHEGPRLVSNKKHGNEHAVTELTEEGGLIDEAEWPLLDPREIAQGFQLWLELPDGAGGTLQCSATFTIILHAACA
jgi:hypothetical protein